MESGNLSSPCKATWHLRKKWQMEKPIACLILQSSFKVAKLVNMENPSLSTYIPPSGNSSSFMSTLRLGFSSFTSLV